MILTWPHFCLHFGPLSEQVPANEGTGHLILRIDCVILRIDDMILRIGKVIQLIGYVIAIIGHVKWQNHLISPYFQPTPSPSPVITESDRFINLVHVIKLMARLKVQNLIEVCVSLCVASLTCLSAYCILMVLKA